MCACVLNGLLYWPANSPVSQTGRRVHRPGRYTRLFWRVYWNEAGLLDALSSESAGWQTYRLAGLLDKMSSKPEREIDGRFARQIVYKPKRQRNGGLLDKIAFQNLRAAYSSTLLINLNAFQLKKSSKVSTSASSLSKHMSLVFFNYDRLTARAINSNWDSVVCSHHQTITIFRFRQLICPFFKRKWCLIDVFWCVLQVEIRID